jgi:hypothetical protein
MNASSFASASAREEGQTMSKNARQTSKRKVESLEERAIMERIAGNAFSYWLAACPRAEARHIGAAWKIKPLISLYLARDSAD